MIWLVKPFFFLISLAAWVHAQSCLSLCDPWMVARQAPLSIGFFRQEYWSGLHFFLQGIFLTQGSNLGLCGSCITGRFFTTEPLEKLSFLAALGLSCSTLASLYSWYVSSVAVAHRLSCPEVCGILVPQPGIKPGFPAFARQIFNHWTTREAAEPFF